MMPLPRIVLDAKNLSSAVVSAVRRHRPEVVSFDVFDTMLLRRCHPDDITSAVLARMSELTGLSPAQVAELRTRAHRKACAGSTVQGRDPEASIVEWYRDWAALCLDGAPESPDLASRIMAFEFELERSFLDLDPEAVAAVEAARREGVKVVAASDMYLTSSQIEDLLGRDGLFDEIVTSGDVGYLKRTGRLFDHLHATLPVDPRKHLHVGDDLLADCLRPASKGVSTILIRDREHTARRVEASERRLRGYGESTSRGLAVIDQSLSVPYAGDVARVVGFETFGPIMAAFVHALVERCSRAGVDRVYFLAREGLVLKRLYDVFVASTGTPAPPSAYLCVSRYTTLLAQMRDFGSVEQEVVWDNTPSPTPRSLLSILGMSADSLERLCHRHELAPDALLKPGDEDFVRLCADDEVAQAAASTGATMRAGLTEHLRRAGFLDANRVAIVDVGWGGQIQENLTRFLAQGDRAPEVLGLYFGLNARAVRRIDAGMAMEGLVAERWKSDWTSDAIFEFVMALEAGTRAPHGSTIGYGIDGTPVFASEETVARAAEAKDDPTLCAMQVGMVDFMTRYARYAGMSRSSSEDVLPLARSSLSRLVRFPSTNERDAFFGMVNVANLGSEEVLPYIDPRISWRRPWFSLKKARWSLWQEGALGRLVGWPGQFALVVAKSALLPYETVPGPSNGRAWRDSPSDHPVASPLAEDALWQTVVDRARADGPRARARTKFDRGTLVSGSAWLAYALCRRLRGRVVQESGMPKWPNARTERTAAFGAFMEVSLAGTVAKLAGKVLSRAFR